MWQLPGLPSPLNGIYIHCGVTEACCIKTHFLQMHLERAWHIPITQNKYSIVIEASKDGQTLLLQLLNCYGDLENRSQRTLVDELLD